MSERIVYQVQDLSKFYGQVEVLSGITLSFLEGAKIGVIGANGAGKSTLLRIIAGEDTQFEGVAKPAAGVNVGYLAQEPPLNDDKNVEGNLLEAVQPLLDIRTRYEEVSGLLGSGANDEENAKLDAEFERLNDEMTHKNLWEGEIESALEQAAAALTLPPLDADVTVLSGGERRRVALCKLLLAQPDILLLDEPTNHLDADSVEWLEHHLAGYAGTVMLITHDRYFLDNVVGWMLEIERGRGIPYEGNYSTYLEAKQKQLNVKRQGDSKRQKLISSELEWIRRTPKARQTRSKARLQRYQELIQQRADEQLESIELRIPPGPRLGDQVITVRDLNKGFGDRTLIQDLDFELPPGGILGVIGANGMGKSTLMKMLIDKETPDSGSITIGSTVEMVYLDQSRTVLDDELSVYDNITEGNDLLPFAGRTIDGRAFVARFNFKGEDQQKLLKECSGGMRNRVLLAKLLKEPANVIILDEPTNDLDLDTLRVLEEAIGEYPGSMIIVSHDRYFLNRVATHILAFEGEIDGKPEVNFHHGDYDSYHEWREKDRSARGINPRSRAGKYRKLIRAD